MITNEERREVAEEMRQRMREGYNFTALNIADEIDVNEADYDEPYRFDDDCWKRLADLIEPEPERTCKEISNSNMYHGAAYEVQLSCDHTCICEWDEKLKYCPECGAKVVNNAD